MSLWAAVAMATGTAARRQEGQMEAGESLAQEALSFEFSWDVLLYNLTALVATFLLALPVAWDREQQRRSAGLRTFPLVAVSSCAYVLVAHAVFGADTQVHSRMLQGLATGIGFVGGGAILKSGDRVTGTATAAGIWAMGAMGAAVAYRRLEIALLLALFTLATLRWLKPFKKQRARD